MKIMTKVAMLLGTCLLITNTAFAGGDTSSSEITCTKEVITGDAYEHVYKKGATCTAKFYYGYRRSKPIGVWLTFRPIGKLTSRRFLRTVVARPVHGSIPPVTMRFALKYSGTYNFSIDTNNNGFLDDAGYGQTLNVAGDFQ